VALGKVAQGLGRICCTEIRVGVVSERRVLRRSLAVIGFDRYRNFSI